MHSDLSKDTELKTILDDISPIERNPDWVSSLTDFLEYVEGADLETRKTLEFQQKLWEENAVSGVGMGTVNISAALEDPEFRSWIAEESLKPLPESSEARITRLQAFHDEIANCYQTVDHFRDATKMINVRAIKVAEASMC